MPQAWGGGDRFDHTITVTLLVLIAILYMLPTLIAYAGDISLAPDHHRRQHRRRLDADRLGGQLHLGNEGENPGGTSCLQRHPLPTWQRGSKMTFGGAVFGLLMKAPRYLSWRGYAYPQRHHAAELIRVADKARDRRRWAVAARRYGEALAIDPEQAAIWVQHGHALKELGDLSRAEAAYRESLEIDAVAADTYLQLGHVLKLQGRLAEAIAVYRTALYIDPDLSDARDEIAALDPPPAIEISDAYRSMFRDVLLRTFFKDWPPEQKLNGALDGDLSDHIELRYNNYANIIVPWLKSAAPSMQNWTAVEVGSGTGASTLAFAPHLERVICYEISSQAIEAAKARMDFFGIKNVTILEEPLSASSDLGSVDLCLFCAVLEHMTFDELKESVRKAWGSLKSGGLFVVADTPNRLNIFDYHTSRLPFFSALPLRLRQEYSVHSPRKEFRQGIALSANPEDALVRWGAGISYHDLDLAIGRDYHAHIVLDGYEKILNNLEPVLADDRILRTAFAHLDYPAHRAFTRHNLCFAIRKP